MSEKRKTKRKTKQKSQPVVSQRQRQTVNVYVGPPQTRRRTTPKQVLPKNVSQNNMMPSLLTTTAVGMLRQDVSQSNAMLQTVVDALKNQQAYIPPGVGQRPMILTQEEEFNRRAQNTPTKQQEQQKIDDNNFAKEIEAEALTFLKEGGREAGESSDTPKKPYVMNELRRQAMLSLGMNIPQEGAYIKDPEKRRIIEERMREIKKEDDRMRRGEITEEERAPVNIFKTALSQVKTQKEEGEPGPAVRTPSNPDKSSPAVTRSQKGRKKR
jgi:hypothetical protein